MTTKAKPLKLYKELPQVTGFFVNTNDSGLLYENPWDNAEARIALRQLLRWQDRYGAISENYDFNGKVEDGE
ncbi:hypothetical protein HFO49_26145 [Rhizobium leguminosarum]|uniref:hypothetical protein n=1 Tax=Rhizobium leguminosarum TaxID=384 RepID=UPI001C97953B|nr:hypothetical protein [Rhizobium leguminosarum]MBY5590926.1 hypothetical protein [Rhizobium leguminosarum]